MFKFGLKEAKGKIVTIDIGIRPYNGKEYNQVTNVYPIAGSTVTAEDVAADFGDIPDLGGVSTSTAGFEAVKADEPSLDIDLNISDEDLPF